MNNIKGILVSIIAPFEDHIANGGEKAFGNASTIKVRPDGRVYVSGQKQRHSFFAAMDRLNAGENDTYVTNGDGISNVVEKDLRADLGGYLHPSEKSFIARRIAPLTATPAVAIDPSEIGRDLKMRLNNNEAGNTQAIATAEFSQRDLMVMNFFLDISALSIRKKYEYSETIHQGTSYVKHVTEDERLRRAKLMLEATASLTDYANQARNAVAAEPQQVLIVLDTKLSRKASRYFKASEVERKNIIDELESRGAKYYLGDDTGLLSDKSVLSAYQEAITELKSSGLYDPSNGAEPKTTAEYIEGLA